MFSGEEGRLTGSRALIGEFGSEALNGQSIYVNGEIIEADIWMLTLNEERE